MTVTEMRNALKQRYGDTIRGTRVDWMPEDQVVAIYRSLVNRKDPFINKPRGKSTYKYEQLRMEI